MKIVCFADMSSRQTEITFVSCCIKTTLIRIHRGVTTLMYIVVSKHTLPLNIMSISFSVKLLSQNQYSSKDGNLLFISVTFTFWSIPFPTLNTRMFKAIFSLNIWHLWSLGWEAWSWVPLQLSKLTYKTIVLEFHCY